VLKVTQGQHNKPKAAVRTVEMTEPIEEEEEETMFVSGVKRQCCEKIAVTAALASRPKTYTL
jgi:hypothetical protein